MLQNPIRRSTRTHREGKVLVGCLIALGVALLLAITATILIVMSWSKMTGWLLEKGAESMVAQLPIDETEKGEVMAELSGLMTQYKDKDLDFEQLALRLESVIESPSVQAGLISNAAGMYINSSPLSDEEKAGGVNELRRLASGILNGSIDPNGLRDLLEPLHGDGTSSETITLGIHINGTGKDEYKILKPSAVTKEQITQVIDAARVQADEAGVEATPAPIDLSDEIKQAIESSSTRTTIEPAILDEEP